MPLRMLFGLLGCICVLLPIGGHAQVTSRVDWPSFLARQDLVWERLPTSWGEGAFLGNGQLGAMVYADSKNALSWHIGRTDVVFHTNRIPIGELQLHPVGKIQSVSMRLDLWDAELHGTLKTDAGEIAFRSLTHAAQMVQLIEIAPSAGEKGCTFSWVPGRAVSPRLLYRKEPIPATEENPDPVTTEAGGMHRTVQPLRPDGAHVTVWQDAAGAGGRRLVALSVGYAAPGGHATTPDAETASAAQTVQAAEATGFDALVATHRAWWHRFYPESFVSIPDARLESFYWIQMYKMASGTRADRPALDLMGPWTSETPWPKIWWNLNIQLTYWPALTSNRLELSESLCRMLDRGADNLAKNAGEFSADSATIGTTSSYDCVSPGGRELCDLPWAMHNYYLQYRYTMDDARLRDHIYPLLRRSVNFYLHQLTTDPDGMLHISRGSSPEYPNQPPNETDCNIDLALLRWGCQTLLQTCAHLKIQDPLIPTWSHTLAKLTPYPTDENGLMVSAEVPFAVSHRHYSHLLMIYPLYLMTPEQPENRALVTKSLRHWMGLSSELQGFSYTGAASISALLGNGDDAAMYLNRLLDTKIHPNTMYTEAGPVIETPLSAAASIHDMLLSSWGDKIRVFPGIPHAWRDIAFDHLRAQGAFLVSAVRAGGATRFVRIESLAGQPCRVWTDMDDPVADTKLPVRSLGGGVLEVGLKRGQSVILHPRKEHPILTIAPVGGQAGRRNFFGSKGTP